jgi:carboxyl-terminal processing protease
VSEVYSGSPADKANVQVGDKVSKINGHVVKNTPLEELEPIIEGKSGKELNIEVTGASGVRDISLPMKNIDVPAVSDKELGNGIVYIKIRDFFGPEASQLANALAKHKDAKAFVLDLRDNPGGQFSQALQSAELFLDHGTVVETRDREPSDLLNPKFKESEYDLTRRQFILNGEPEPRMYKDLVGARKVAVLTNKHTQSSAEILAAALNETGGMPLVGTATFGKGIGQLVTNFPDGSAEHVTYERWFTPKHEWIGTNS